MLANKLLFFPYEKQRKIKDARGKDKSWVKTPKWNLSILKHSSGCGSHPVTKWEHREIRLLLFALGCSAQSEAPIVSTLP